MAQAFVNEIIAKPVKDGAMIMYDYVLSDGNKVGAGKFKLKGIETGDYIEYDVNMNGSFKNFKPGSVSKLDKPAGVTPPSAKPGFVPSDQVRQEIISRQSALNSSLQFTNLLATLDALPLPKATKVSERADLILDIVTHYTAEFYRQSTGNEMKLEAKTEAASEGRNLKAAEGEDNWEG